MTETSVHDCPWTASAYLHPLLLQQAPLQYQGLLEQANLANAQGRTTLAQGILKQAQDHLDTIFQIGSSRTASNFFR